MRKTICTMILATAAALGGCQQAAVEKSAGGETKSSSGSAESSSHIGTMNVGRIYRMLGLQQERDNKENELRQRLNRTSEEYKARVADRLKELGGDREKLSDEQKSELRKLEAEHDLALRQAHGELQQEQARFNQFLNNKFEVQTRDPIRKIAERHGLDMVMILQPNVFVYLKPSIDITDEVIKEIGLPATLPGASPPTGSPAAGAGPLLPGGLPAGQASPATDGGPKRSQTGPDSSQTSPDSSQTSPDSSQTSPDTPQTNSETPKGNAGDSTPGATKPK